MTRLDDTGVSFDKLRMTRWMTRWTTRGEERYWGSPSEVGSRCVWNQRGPSAEAIGVNARGC